MGTGTGYSVLEMISALQEVSGRPLAYKVVERRKGDVGEVVANPNHCMKLLGWSAEKSLKEMCRDSWNWQYNNPGGYRSDNEIEQLEYYRK